MEMIMKIKTIVRFNSRCLRIVGLACLLGSLLWSPVKAQTTMRKVFSEMPDSLMPYLTKNNRLDLIDFFESSMKAEVTNNLDGHSQLTALTTDSLSLQLSAALRIDMLLLPVKNVIDDSLTHVVCVFSKYGVTPAIHQTVVRYYSPQWQQFTEKSIPLSADDRKRINRLLE